jgi:hypothetical protein
MAVPKIEEAINDFSAGELDADVKRSSTPLNRLGGRQAANWRILNTHKKANRPGRIALFLAQGRSEEFVMAGSIFFLNFAAGSLKVYNAAGAQVFSTTTFLPTPTGTPYAIPWTAPTLGGITWVQVGKTIYIAYPDGAPNNVPQVLSFDGVSTWMLTPYAETVAGGGQKRTAFYRISPQNVTLQPSATSGTVTITFSSAILSAAMIGTRLEYCTQQLTITGVSSPTTGTAIVNENLPPGQTLSYSTLQGAVNVGDVLLGSVSGAAGVVTQSGATQNLQFSSGSGYVNIAHIGDTVTEAFTSASGVVTGSNYNFDGSTYTVYLTVLVTAANFTTGHPIVGPLGTHNASGVSGLSASGVVVQLIPNGSNIIQQFTTADTAVGPSGNFRVTAQTVIVPQPVTIWADEVMNTFRGYPSAVFYDQARLGLANFPSLPNGVAWSAVNLPYDLYVGAQPDDAIFELAPDDSQVFYVVPGMESSEFVFTDRAIYYIPINQNNPLKPGSVAFNKLSDFGCLPGVQPRRADQTIVYVKAGGTTIGAVQAPGAYYRPYVIDSISEMHSHLFTASRPLAMAIPSGPTQFEELYLYLVLANGTAVVGRYIMRNGLIEPGVEGKPTIGWLPWTGAGSIGWIAARQGDVIFTTTYGAVSIVEQLDNTQYLDGALFVNNVPAALAPPAGKGPLFNFPGPNTTVFLIDRGTRFMDTYSVDANGFVIPQFIGGENLASPQLVAGQPWTATFEPFMPHAPPGPDNAQRTRRRKVARGFVSVQNSTGFVFGRRRVPAYYIDEDATQPAPLREANYTIRPLGRRFDPRLVLSKDTPGPLTIVEYNFEVTV